MVSDAIISKKKSLARLKKIAHGNVSLQFLAHVIKFLKHGEGRVLWTLRPFCCLNKNLYLRVQCYLFAIIT